MLWSIRQGEKSGIQHGAVAFSEKFRQAGICDPSYKLAAVCLLVCRCDGFLPGWDCGLAKRLSEPTKMPILF